MESIDISGSKSGDPIKRMLNGNKTNVCLLTFYAGRLSTRQRRLEVHTVAIAHF